jgi:hypothetical protein
VTHGSVATIQSKTFMAGFQHDFKDNAVRVHDLNCALFALAKGCNPAI